MVPNSTRWTGPWLGATRATSLQRVANRAIVCHVLDALLAVGVSETVMVAPADVAEEVAACVAAEAPPGMTVRHLAHENRGDDSELLPSVVELIGEASCILHRADGLLGQPLHPYVSLEQPPDALLLVGDPGTHHERLRLVPPPAGSELDTALAPVGTAGMCVLGPRMLARLPNPERSAQLLDFGAIAEQLARDGTRTEVRVARRWRHFAGDALDLLDLNRTVLDSLESEMTGTTSEGNRFEGHIAIHPTARVVSSVIIGPVVLGADALVTDSYIGPHTSIGDRVRIEGSELERSIVLADASVLYVGRRLVASIVGREARVFRDFSVPRALRLQVGDGDEVALC